jgi:hypothetical protein
MNKISFFTPVYYEDKPKSIKEFFLEKVDAYFYLGGRKARVISGLKEDSQEVELVRSSPSIFTTSLKVASYITIIIPLIMLVAKAILRSGHDFHVVKKNPPNSHSLPEEFNSNPLSNPSTKINVVLNPTSALNKADPTTKFVRKFLNLKELNSHLEAALKYLEEFATTLESQSLTTNYVNDVSENIMRTKAQLTYPLDQPINEENLLEWKKILDKFFDAKCFLNSILIKMEQETGRKDKAFLSIQVKISTELDLILPCISEAFYIFGDADTAGLIIKKIVHTSEVKDVFFARLAEDYYRDGDRDKALKTIKEIIHDSDTKEAFFARLAEDY